MEMIDEEEDYSDDDTYCTLKQSATYTPITEKIENFVKKNSSFKISDNQTEEIEIKSIATTQECTSAGSFETQNIYSGIYENASESVCKDSIKDVSTLDSTLLGNDSFEHTVQSISSLDSMLRELSVVDHGNIIDYISYGVAEAISGCGENLLSTAGDVKRDIKKNRIFRY